jgi:predicted KAP-like P-loop ATPase
MKGPTIKEIMEDIKREIAESSDIRLQVWVKEIEANCNKARIQFTNHPTWNLLMNELRRRDLL